PVRSRQFLDVSGTVCPFSMWYEIERAVKRKPEEAPPCPYIGPQELTSRRESDEKTIWHYRKCLYEVSQEGR
ncbi:unnamed protein product, partial [marine sediment metagenome]